jgi:hypothetical protein
VQITALFWFFMRPHSGEAKALFPVRLCIASRRLLPTSTQS